MMDLKLNSLDDNNLVERFTPTDLLALRSELTQTGVDSFQAAQIVTNFLSGRGYGVSPQDSRAAAQTIDRPGCTPDLIQAELERVARVM